MLRAFKTFAAALLIATAPVALAASSASASELSDAYNNQTDRDFRLGMQMRLAWTGDYQGDFSGLIDAASLRAIRDFQARHGMEANGVITEPFLKLLVSQSDDAQKTVGFELVDDRTTGVRVALPLGLVSDNGRTPIGRVWRSADRRIEIETVRLAGPEQSVEAVHAMLTHPTASRTVDSDVSFEGGFTVAGTENGRPYLMRFKGVEGDVRGFGVSYESSVSSVVVPYALVASNLFDPTMPAPEEAIVTAGLDPSHLGMKAVEGSQALERSRGLFDASASPQGGKDGSEAQPEQTDSSGSGFVVSHDGWVLTNAHVAESCRAVLVGDKGVADRVVVDAANDLAAVHVGAKLAEPLAIASGTPRLGEDVLALGFPLRSILADSLNVTRGNVSSLLGLQNDPRYLQISAPVQRGNSGGPLIDLSGRVVGVVTAKLDAVAIADATGDIPQSINFAIRPDAVSTFLKDKGIAFTPAAASKDFGSVADTTARVQDSVLPILCLGNDEQ